MRLTKKQLYKERLALVASRAAAFVSFAGGNRICQETAALNACFVFTHGGSAANAICKGYQYGMSLMHKNLTHTKGANDGTYC